VSEILKNSTTIYENLKNFKEKFEKSSTISENKRKPGKSKQVAKLSKCEK